MRTTIKPNKDQSDIRENHLDQLYHLPDYPNSTLSGVHHLQLALENKGTSVKRIIQSASATKEEELIEVAKEQLAERIQNNPGFDRRLFDDEIVSLSKQKDKESITLCLGMLRTLIEEETTHPSVRKDAQVLLNRMQLKTRSLDEILNNQDLPGNVCYLDESDIKRIIRDNNPGELEILRFHGNSAVQDLLHSELKSVDENDNSYQINFTRNYEEGLLNALEVYKEHVSQAVESNSDEKLLAWMIIPLIEKKDASSQVEILIALAAFMEKASTAVKAIARKLYIRMELAKKVTSPRILTREMSEFRIELNPPLQNENTNPPTKDLNMLMAELHISKLTSRLLIDLESVSSIFADQSITDNSLITSYIELKNIDPEYGLEEMFLRSVAVIINSMFDLLIIKKCFNALEWFKDNGNAEAKRISNSYLEMYAIKKASLQWVSEMQQNAEPSLSSAIIANDESKNEPEQSTNKKRKNKNKKKKNKANLFRSLLENPQSTWEQLVKLFENIKNNKTNPDQDACGIFLLDNIAEQIIKESDPRISALYEKTVNWFKSFGSLPSQEIAREIILSCEKIHAIEDTTISQLEKNKKDKNPEEQSTNKAYLLLPQLTPAYQAGLNTLKQQYWNVLQDPETDRNRLLNDLTLETEEKDQNKRVGCLLKLRALYEIDFNTDITNKAKELLTKMTMQEASSKAAIANGHADQQALESLPALNPQDEAAYDFMKFLFSKNIENKSEDDIEKLCNELIDRTRTLQGPNDLLTLRMLLESDKTSINIKQIARELYNQVSPQTHSDPTPASSIPSTEKDKFKNLLLNKIPWEQILVYLQDRKKNDVKFLSNDIKTLLIESFPCATIDAVVIYNGCLKALSWYKRFGTKKGKEAATAILKFDTEMYQQSLKERSDKNIEQNGKKPSDLPPTVTEEKHDDHNIQIKEAAIKASRDKAHNLLQDTETLMQDLKKTAKEKSYPVAIKLYAKLFFEDCCGNNDAENAKYLESGWILMSAFASEGYLREASQEVARYSQDQPTIKSPASLFYPTAEQIKESLTVLRKIYAISYDSNTNNLTKDDLNKLIFAMYRTEFWKIIYDAFLNDKGELFLQTVNSLNAFAQLFPKMDSENAHVKMEKILEKYRVPEINLENQILPILNNDKQNITRYENARKLLILCKRSINDAVRSFAEQNIEKYPLIQIKTITPVKEETKSEPVRKQPTLAIRKNHKSQKEIERQFEKIAFEAEKKAEEEKAAEKREAKIAANTASENAKKSATNAAGHAAAAKANVEKAKKSVRAILPAVVTEIAASAKQASTNANISAALAKAYAQEAAYAIDFAKTVKEANAATDKAKAHAKFASAAIKPIEDIKAVVDMANEVKKTKDAADSARVYAASAKTAIVSLAVIVDFAKAKEAALVAATSAEEAKSSAQKAIAAIALANLNKTKLAEEVKTESPPKLLVAKYVALPDFKQDDPLLKTLEKLVNLTKHEVFVGGSTPVHIHRNLPLNDWDVRIPHKLKLNLNDIVSMMTGWHEIATYEIYSEATHPIIYATIKNPDGTTQELDISLYEQINDETPEETMLRRMNEEADYNVSAFCLKAQMNHDGGFTGKAEFFGNEKDIQDYLDGYINIVTGGEERVCKNDARQLFRYPMKNELIQLKVHPTLDVVLKTYNTEQSFKDKLRIPKQQRQISTFLQKNLFSGTNTIVAGINLLQKYSMFEPFTGISFESIKDSLSELSIYDNSNPYTKKLAFYAFILAHKCAQITKLENGDKSQALREWQWHEALFATTFVIMPEDRGKKILDDIAKRILAYKITDTKSEDFLRQLSIIHPKHFEIGEDFKRQKDQAIAFHQAQIHQQNLVRPICPQAPGYTYQQVPMEYPAHPPVQMGYYAHPPVQMGYYAHPPVPVIPPQAVHLMQHREAPTQQRFPRQRFFSPSQGASHPNARPQTTRNGRRGPSNKFGSER